MATVLCGKKRAHATFSAKLSYQKSTHSRFRKGVGSFPDGSPVSVLLNPGQIVGDVNKVAAESAHGYWGTFRPHPPYPPWVPLSILQADTASQTRS